MTEFSFHREENWKKVIENNGFPLIPYLKKLVEWYKEVQTAGWLCGKVI